MTPLSAPAALNTYFLEARSKLLDLAGILDRIDRGANPTVAMNDPRWQRIQEAFQLLGADPLRAERIQDLFSLPYDPGWAIPQPK